MLFSRQQLRVFTLMTVYVALAQASWFNSNPFRREVVKKDLLSGINSAVDGLLGTSAASTTADTSSSTTESSAPTASSSSSTPTPTPTTSSSTPPQKTSSTSTPPSDDSSTSDTPTPTPTPTKSNDNNSQSVATTTQVVAGGSPTKDSTSSQTSSSSASSSTASLGQNEVSSSTMSPKTKTTVIGVVVGVGGTIVLAGLFVVAWRIWGRKKNEDESDGLMGFRSGSTGHEKSGSVSGGGAPNPFQSTLENYHNPSRNVNASSNF
ncbi:hypothetical protein L207DRAFT_518682 [Hyaloscypha variabilis F]|uniref:Mid2 domain-containing protein n=1 Tax=Hyaloscypha variabilis (strain UAMH 11265 / GT02V1 / F) TaxID=1149755 RepID=A0A2J6R178_HYAVF|nr:hypothetical protein L207DRAFT_518682 [Hyaloscypha variabilis F]